MLPGLKTIPGFLAGGAASLAGATLSVSSTTATASTIAWPAVSAGDLAIISDGATSTGGAPSDVTPSGFTGVSTATKGSARWRLSYKKCTGSESGSITGMNGSAFNAKVLLILRSSAGAINTVTPSVFNTQALFGNPSSRTISVSAGTAPLIVIGVGYAADTTAPNWTTQTPTWAATVTGAAKMNLGYRTYNANPTTDQVMDCDGTGYTIMAGGYIQVA